MKCQRKYQWVKLPRNCLPQGKGVLGHWARLAARAAYRKGIGTYCGFENEVLPGMWAGGVVGLKSILGTRSRRPALETLEQLQELGFLSYSLDLATKMRIRMGPTMVTVDTAVVTPFFRASSTPAKVKSSASMDTSMRAV